MRAGYLATLASRTLGVAPVLRPVTPSRFEPEGPQAELREIAEIEEARADPTGVPWRASAQADETRLDAAHAAGRSLRGSVEPEFAEEPAVMRSARDGWAVPGAGWAVPGAAWAVPGADWAVPGAGWAAGGPAGHAGDWAGPDGLAGSAGRAAGSAAGFAGQFVGPAGHAGDDRLMAPLATSATGPEVLGHAAALTPDAAGALSGLASGMAGQYSAAPGGRASWHEDVIQAGRSRQETGSAGRTGELAEAGSAEPAIVVRIGRVDVRAVQAAQPPAPAARPRPPAGPSLAEHLLARDRRRR